MAAVTETVTLLLPQLAQDGVLGSGCCAVPAAPAIERDLLGWAGVRRVEVDQPAGLVRVVVAGGRPRPDEIAWSLRMLGLAEARILDEERDSG